MQVQVIQHVNVTEVREDKMRQNKKSDTAIAETLSAEARTFGYVVGNRPDDQEFPQDLLETEEVTTEVE